MRDNKNWRLALRAILFRRNFGLNSNFSTIILCFSRTQPLLLQFFSLGPLGKWRKTSRKLKREYKKKLIFMVKGESEDDIFKFSQ